MAWPSNKRNGSKACRREDVGNRGSGRFNEASKGEENRPQGKKNKEGDCGYSPGRPISFWKVGKAEVVDSKVVGWG